jgi:nucleotide-binding universal stress UspA family protein
MNGRVVVGFAPTPAGYQALRYAVEQATERGSCLVVVRAIRVEPYEWTTDARLHTTVKVAAEVANAFREAMGGIPGGVEVRVIADPGQADKVLRAIATQPDDLVIVGACTRRGLLARVHGATLRRCLRALACPVVVIPPPAMARDGSAERLGRELVSEVEHHLRRPVELTS